MSDSSLYLPKKFLLQRLELSGIVVSDYWEGIVTRWKGYIKKNMTVFQVSTIKLQIEEGLIRMDEAARFIREYIFI